MSIQVKGALDAIADFVVNATVGAAARERAAVAFKDTIGVALAGAGEPAARIAQALASEEGTGTCRILGTALATSPGFAALANGVSAHSLNRLHDVLSRVVHVVVPADGDRGEL